MRQRTLDLMAGTLPLKGADVGHGNPGTITFVCVPKGHEVAFRGEFDISCYATLGSALEDALRREAKIFVDLSGVTFMDASCVRELALLGSLYGERMVLETPSRQVEVAVAACGMEDLLWFSVMSPGDAGRLADAMERRLRSRVGTWEGAGRIALHDAMREVEGVLRPRAPQAPDRPRAPHPRPAGIPNTVREA